MTLQILGVGRSRLIVLVCVILRSASDVDDFVWEKASFGLAKQKQLRLRPQ